MDFSQRLKKAMVDQNITQADLSTMTGIGRSGISQYCSGKNKPGLKALTTIADALKVSEAWLTGERVQVQNKGEKPFEFNNYAKFIFSANTIPRIKDKTGAVLRRLLIVPFNANFTRNDSDHDAGIKYKLQDQEVMEYLIVIGLEALKNVIANKGFTESEKVQEQLKEYEETNNPILGFFEECDMEGFKIEDEQTDKVFRRYKEYCVANNFNAMSKSEFSKTLCRKLGMTTKSKTLNGKSFRIYAKG